MNNLQFLYQFNSDFRSFIDNHLTVFEHWYRTELGETRIEDDIEAEEWLMAPAFDSGSDYNDHILPDPCLRLDFGGVEYESIELGDGTGYVRASELNEAIAQFNEARMEAKIQHESDLGALKLYAKNVRDLLVEAYQIAYSMYVRVPLKDKTVEETQRMTDLFQAAHDLGIEIEL